MAMAEEFDELTSKILKEELTEGLCIKIVDDCYVGGDSQIETAENYKRIVTKLAKANLKISPEKSYIFPKEADVLGWTWHKGGYLSASPHRKLALTNTKVEDTCKVRDMRSWVGLFKTLHMVTPNIADILMPFEQATAGKDTSEKFEWTHELERQFREAKNTINHLIKLYLPSPNDQLVLQTDASRQGLGHVLFAIKEGKKFPARIHSVLMPKNVQNGAPEKSKG